MKLNLKGMGMSPAKLAKKKAKQARIIQEKYERRKNEEAYPVRGILKKSNSS